MNPMATGGSSRRRTGFSGFDRLLGGGLPASGVVVLAGDPGAGKTRWLLQLIRTLQPVNCLLLATSQSKGDFDRSASDMGMHDAVAGLFWEEPQTLDDVLLGVNEISKPVVLWDSINKLGGEARSPAAVEKRMVALRRDARETKRLYVVVSEVTKEREPYAYNQLAKHSKAVLLLSNEHFGGGNRVLRRLDGAKRTDRIAFDMTQAGLVEIDTQGSLDDAMPKPAKRKKRTR